MKNVNNFKIGLIGGMGPFAGARFLQMFLEKFAAKFNPKKDNDFPEIILDSVSVPEFISDTKNLSVAKSVLISRVRTLSSLGCNPTALICNTGHILFPEMLNASGGKMISLIETVRDNTVKRNIKRVGLLATNTTIKSGLYENAFKSTGATLVIPNESLISICDQNIRGEITNRNSKSNVNKLMQLTKEFIKKENLDSVILGCTELPLAFTSFKSDKIIDCLEVLSDKFIELAKVQEKN